MSDFIHLTDTGIYLNLDHVTRIEKMVGKLIVLTTHRSDSGSSFYIYEEADQRALLQAIEGRIQEHERVSRMLAKEDDR